ncbi:Kelch repeat-containing protein [Nonomuraea sp. 3N208]|uniref:Kelch repeat-containing protein n=1 Tax=Nonomuraea sp. 3N208 TaxID=3457421 RepID=UPI003FD66B62
MVITRRDCLAGLLLAGLSAGCGTTPATRAQRAVRSPRVIAPAPIKGRVGHRALWTGTEMLVWAGLTREDQAIQVRAVTDGAAYDPASDSWRRIADMPLSGREGMAAAWTGQSVLCWGGRAIGEREQLFGDGAAYDPQTNRWTSLAEAPIGARTGAAAAWTGREMVVWAGQGESTETHAKDGAAHDPATGSWRPIPPAPLPDFYEHAVVWTGQELVAFVGAFGDDRPAVIAAAYDPARGSWRKLPAAPVARGSGTPVWDGRRILLLATGPDMITGGEVNPFPTPLAPIGAYVPDTDSWTMLTRAPAIHNGSFTWTGRAAAFWNGDPTGGLAYIADQDRWVRLPAHDGSLRESPSSVWTGTELIVWGGNHSYGPTADGPLRPLNDGVALRPDLSGS